MLISTDLFIVERGGILYKMTADEIATFVGAVKDFTATTYANMLSGTYSNAGVAKVGDRIFVVDASGDATVTSGYAVYRVDTVGPLTHTKLTEQESMDLTVISGSNLSYTPSTGIVANDNGSGFTIPLVNGTDRGLATPSMFINSHVAATTSGTSASNPITLSGQEISFGINALTALP